jgi:hypothetical protein
MNKVQSSVWKGCLPAGAIIAFAIAMGVLVWLNTGCTSALEQSMNIPEYKAVVLSVTDITYGKDTYVNVYRLKDIERGIVFNKQMPIITYYEVGDTIILKR